MLHRGAGDDHAVKALVLDLVKGLVKREQVLLRGVFRHVRPGVDQLELHLQRGVAQKPRKLGLGVDLGDGAVPEVLGLDAVADGIVYLAGFDLFTRGNGTVKTQVFLRL